MNKLSFHHDHPAINVKFYGPYPKGGTDAQREEAETTAREQWWEAAGYLAKTHGYTDVESHGRMGGWLIPYDEGHDKRRHYNDFPNPERYPIAEWEESEREAYAAFQKFAEAVEALRQRFPAMFAEELAYVISRDEEAAAAEREATAKAAAIEAATENAIAALRLLVWDTPEPKSIKSAHGFSFNLARAALNRLDAAEAMP